MCLADVQVYLPMSYVWGIRGTCKRTDLTAAIKDELYPGPYDQIDWDAARNQCAPSAKAAHLFFLWLHSFWQTESIA